MGFFGQALWGLVEDERVLTMVRDWHFRGSANVPRYPLLVIGA